MTEIHNRESLPVADDPAGDLLYQRLFHMAACDRAYSRYLCITIGISIGPTIELESVNHSLYLPHTAQPEVSHWSELKSLQTRPLPTVLRSEGTSQARRSDVCQLRTGSAAGALPPQARLGQQDSDEVP